MSWTIPATVTTGQLMTAAFWNANVRDDMIDVRHYKARKAADESRTATTTVANDAELFVPVLANETWAGVFHIFYDGLAAADIKWTLVAPSGTITWSALGFGPSETTDPASLTINGDAGAGSGALTSWGCLGVGSTLSIPISFSIAVGATPGNVNFQWAQANSNATATKVRLGSHVEAFRI